MLLLLHGAVGDRRTYDRLLPALAAHGVHDAHPIDFEGHGERPAAGRAFQLEHFTENALEWLQSQPDQPVDVFGYSMGGYVALLLAAAHPDRIRSVFTLGTKLVWSPAVADAAIAQLDPVRMAQKVPQFAALLQARHVASGWDVVLHGTAHALATLGNAPLLTPTLLARITCPVRLALGDRDFSVPLEELRDAIAVLPRGSAEVLPDTPHPLERTPLDRLARSLSEFRGASSSG